MLAELLVKEDVQQFYNTLPADTMIANPQNRMGCMLATFLKSKHPELDNKLTLDFTTIYIENDSIQDIYTRETIPEWAQDAVSALKHRTTDMWSPVPVSLIREVLNDLEV